MQTYTWIPEQRFVQRPLPLPRISLHEDVFEHFHVSEADRAELATLIRKHEVVELRTVGIDIGSSTSHLVFSKIVLQREAELSSRFLVVERELISESPIVLTPFLGNAQIDVAQLRTIVSEAYETAGLDVTDIDSGAVILTGEAIKRRNARAIDELFAREAGRFVCATAGHKLEAQLAAHGSGAVKLAASRGEPVLHVDIGGGTTKFALIDGGAIVSVAAIAIGGRVLATDRSGDWTRIDESAELVAKDLGIPATPASFQSKETRRTIARRFASILVDVMLGETPDALASQLLLTEELARTVKPSAVTFSGGVSEYVFGRETHDHGDIGNLLADALRAEFSRRLDVPVIDPGVGIRATAIGASQFTVQVSGKTIYLPHPELLPLRNVPVVHVDVGPEPETHALSTHIVQALERFELTPDATLALAFSWTAEPEYGKLAALARAIGEVFAPHGARADRPLLLVIDGDVAQTLGRLLDEELHFARSLIVLDGLLLRDFDFVDVGELVDGGVVPVVIKSLLFST